MQKKSSLFFAFPSASNIGEAKVTKSHEHIKIKLKKLFAVFAVTAVTRAITKLLPSPFRVLF
ncbi:MAG: hypothetical protein IJV34_04850 [Prevotella sp.]|nr:hypothetical protein [Prevotella sp.]